ncbi:hypothetical protein F5Y17DRAFT_166154 [Xylariaceae sp. FL0594]|nr:hypothetical protein F5Y17DRAFT_166154 [Xylariaceae sp. FL0594]
MSALSNCSAGREESLEEEKPFLEVVENDFRIIPSHRISRTRLIWIGSISINLFFISLYTAIFIFSITSSQTNCPRSPQTPSAINHALQGLEYKYTPTKFTGSDASPYVGPASSSVDKAWHELLKYTTLRASGEELEKRNQSSVELPDGGYMVWLGVFHQLHCVKTLRQWNYREHYHPNLTNKERSHWEVHVDHCLDQLRNILMCRADTTLTTFRWTVDQRRPMLNTRPVERQCVDWELLMGSLKHRVVEGDEMGRMRNPIFHSSPMMN